MPTAKDIIADADSRYRNTFALTKKIEWLNYVYQQVRKKMHIEDELDSAVIQLQEHVPLYSTPEGIPPFQIRKIEVETGTDSNEFRPIPFKATDEDADLNEFWTFLTNYIFLYPTPTQTAAMVVYYVASDQTITEANYETFLPEIDLAYQEMLVYMLVERYAAARKDVTMKTNYANDAALMENDMRWTDITSLPEYPGCRDVMPRRSRTHGRTLGSRFAEDES